MLCTPGSHSTQHHRRQQSSSEAEQTGRDRASPAAPTSPLGCRLSSSMRLGRCGAGAAAAAGSLLPTPHHRIASTCTADRSGLCILTDSPVPPRTVALRSLWGENILERADVEVGAKCVELERPAKMVVKLASQIELQRPAKKWLASQNSVGVLPVSTLHSLDSSVDKLDEVVSHITITQIRKPAPTIDLATARAEQLWRVEVVGDV